MTRRLRPLASRITADDMIAPLADRDTEGVAAREVRSDLRRGVATPGRLCPGRAED